LLAQLTQEFTTLGLSIGIARWGKANKSIKLLSPSEFLHQAAFANTTAPLQDDQIGASRVPQTAQLAQFHFPAYERVHVSPESGQPTIWCGHIWTLRAAPNHWQ
jgi:hypothetical protein